MADATEYIHRMILDGEVLNKMLGKQESSTKEPEKLHNLIASIALALRDYAKMLTVFQHSPFANEKLCQFELKNLNKHYQGLIDLANKWELKNQSGEALFGHNRINFYSGQSVFWV